MEEQKKGVLSLDEYLSQILRKQLSESSEEARARAGEKIGCLEKDWGLEGKTVKMIKNDICKDESGKHLKKQV